MPNSDESEPTAQRLPLDPTDVVDRAYELIGFAAGGEPDWQRFRELFTDPCVLALRVFPDDHAITVMDMASYMHHQMQHGLGDDGYSESPGIRTVDIVGDIAIIRQHFTMNFVDAPPVPALDVFALCRRHTEWQIVSILSETQDAPLSLTSLA